MNGYNGNKTNQNDNNIELIKNLLISINHNQVKIAEKQLKLNKAISSILQNNPLLQEPGIKLSHPDVSKYNDIITYKNFDFAIKDIINYANNPNNCSNKILKINTDLTYVINLFIDDIKYNFNKNKIHIIQKINTHNKQYKYKVYASIYALDIYINYNLLINEFNKIEI